MMLVTLESPAIGSLLVQVGLHFLLSIHGNNFRDALFFIKDSCLVYCAYSC